MKKTVFLAVFALIGMCSFAGAEPVSGLLCSARVMEKEFVVAGATTIGEGGHGQELASLVFPTETDEVVWMGSFFKNASFETVFSSGGRFARDEFEWFPFGRDLFVRITSEYSISESTEPKGEYIGIFAGFHFVLGHSTSSRQ